MAKEPQARVPAQVRRHDHEALIARVLRDARQVGRLAEKPAKRRSSLS